MTDLSLGRRVWPCVVVVVCAACAAPADVSIEREDDRFTVKIDGGLFTRYIFKGQDKPVLYPIIGPTGVGLTRNWPLTEAAKGEATDHPHHTALWFNHGNVNGIDFWAAGEGKGKIVADGSPTLFNGGRSLIATNRWVGPDGKTVCTDSRILTFGASEGVRTIDYDITIFASQGDVTFGDTKEGTMAIRTRPELEINHGAAAVNSGGVTGKEIWGKRASWVDYSGVVEGKTVGVAMLAHPSNPRHPTWWHAREYGLIAANPFGVHDFEKKPPGTGDLKIAAGQSVTFRYRFVFHEGDAAGAKVAELYERYASSEPVAPEKPGSE